jgi:hypothetical protein
MGKRVILLYLFFLFCFSGLSQLLQVDSIEVSIVIPEHHKKNIITQQDTLTEEISPKVLTEYMLVDSILPEHRYFSAGRIKIRVDDQYSPFVRPVMHHHNILRLLMSEIYSVDAFNPFRLSHHWPGSPEYKSFVFSLKYQNRDYGSLLDFDSSYGGSALGEYHNYLKYPSGIDFLFPVFEIDLVEQFREQLLIDQPFLTEELWDSIPDPPQLSRGGGFLEKRNANEGFRKLLQWDNPETQKQLDQRADIEKIWTYGGRENVQFSQAFQENWVKGGENSVSLLSDLRLQATYKKNKVEWESYGIHKLGILNTEDNEPRVNDDLIELNTKYGLSAGRKWFYSGLFNFKTQFFDGYEDRDVLKENPVSGFMAPAYLTLALGMDYKEDNFTLMLLPVTSRMTIVADTTSYDQTRYKLPEDRKTHSMGGVSLVNKLEWEFAKGFNLASKMDLFYEYMRSDNQIQAEWELMLDMKINVFLSTRIGTYLRYYSNESEYIQFRENLSISFNYRF